MFDLRGHAVTLLLLIKIYEGNIRTSLLSLPLKYKPKNTMDYSYLTLSALLKKRLHIIADHTWRDDNPAEHLRALGEISIKIESWHQEHRTHIPKELNHFLHQRSFSKALEFVDKVPLVA